MKSRLFNIFAILLLSMAMLTGNTLHATPKKLLIFYGWPAGMNEDTYLQDLDKIAQDMGQYDYVVLGGGLEDASHDNHQETIDIISHSDTVNTQFFGYIPLGMRDADPSNDRGPDKQYTMAEIKQRIDKWYAMGVTGILLDEFGYDYEVSRQRQNEAVAYMHDGERGMSVIANGWVADQIFGSEVDELWNPDGVDTLLNQDDFYLHESYQIQEGEYVSKKDWRDKTNKLKLYQEQIGFRIMGITTNNAANEWNQDKFFYAWYSALMDGYEAVGWGEHWFSPNGDAPYRIRPTDLNPIDFGVFTEEIDDTQNIVTRRSTTGTVSVDTDAHTSEFLSFSEILDSAFIAISSLLLMK